LNVSDVPALDDIKKLMNMLDDSRADNRKKWFQLGACLHNTDTGLLPLWIEFSEKSEKFKDGECEKMWDDFTPGYTVKSLYYWAKEDNPEEFKKFKASTTVNNTKENPKKFDNDEYINENNDTADSTITLEYLQEMAKGYKTESSEDDKMRSIIVGGIYNVSQINGFTERQTMNMIHDFCRLAKTYNEGNVDKLIETLKSAKNLIGLDALIKYLKDDNYGLYHKLFKKIQTYDTLKKEFEKSFFKVFTPVCYVQILDDGRLEIKSRKQFKERCEHIRCIIEKEKRGKKYNEEVEFTSEWFKDSDIRRYDSLSFSPPPEIAPKGSYNTFMGFEAEKGKYVSSGNVEPFLEHCRVMAGNDDVSCKYLIDWLADIIQNPGRLSNVSILLRGEQGTGKNLLIELIAKHILGRRLSFETANPAGELFSKFSKGRKEKLLITINEANGKDTHCNSDLIKDMITSTTLNYEQKGIDSIELNNFARLLWTSNNQNPLKIELKDRRFVVLESGEQYIGNVEYFDRLVAYSKDPRNAFAIWEFLKNRDLSNVHLARDRPITKAYRDMQESSIPVHYRFLNSMVYEYDENEVTMTSQRLFKEFTDWQTRNRHNVPIASNSFGKLIKALADKPKSGIAYCHSKKGTLYNLKFDIVQKYLEDNDIICREKCMFVNDGTNILDV
jgi:hypothetical protein